MQELDELLRRVVDYFSRYWLVPVVFIVLSVALYASSGLFEFQEFVEQTKQAKDAGQKSDPHAVLAAIHDQINVLPMIGYFFAVAIYHYVAYRHPVAPLTTRDFFPLGRFWRLAWAMFLAGLSSGWRIFLLLIPAVILFILMAGTAAVVSGGGAGAKSALASVFVIGVLILYAWVFTRYVLVGAIVMHDEGKAIRTSRRLTAGRSGELFLPTLVCFLPVIAVSLLSIAAEGKDAREFVGTISVAMHCLASMLLGILSNQQYERLVRNGHAG